MELDYMDELLRGVECKLGASVPDCLLKPLLSSLSTPPDSSTPIRSNQRPQPADFGTPMTGPSVGGLPRGEQAAGEGGEGVPDLRSGGYSPDYRVSGKSKQGWVESCRKLKSDMDALRAVDVSLIKKLLAIYDTFEEIRWMIESYDFSDSCESINSSVYESIEQIHEKWVTERRQWQSASSRDLTTWRDDSRSYHVGRLNSTGSRMQAIGEGKTSGYGLSSKWRSPQKEMNSSFPQFTSGKSNFENQRRSSMDHLPIVSSSSVEPSHQRSPPLTRRRRRSSSGALEVSAAETKEKDHQDVTNEQRNNNTKFLLHSRVSPTALESEWVEITDSAEI